ncbi:MAG: cytochrome c [Georgfuchsia sp.]
MKFAKVTLVLLLVFALGIGAFAWSGIYNPGADSPHWKITYALIEASRDRSVERHASTVVVPANLDDPQLILNGAGHYAAMCSDCHLAPGKQDSELRAGLYPLPPNLSETNVDPVDSREAFWIIKHGLKMSAMPAWGMSHDDVTIWSMVAFLRKLPGMAPEQYQEMIAKALPDVDLDSMGGETMPASHGHTHVGYTHASD